MRTIGDLLDAGAPRAASRAAIGTSGTINTLVAMALAARGEDAGRLHGARATREEIHAAPPARARGSTRGRARSCPAWTRSAST